MLQRHFYISLLNEHIFLLYCIENVDIILNTNLPFTSRNYRYDLNLEMKRKSKRIKRNVTAYVVGLVFCGIKSHYKLPCW